MCSNIFKSVSQVIGMYCVLCIYIMVYIQICDCVFVGIYRYILLNKMMLLLFLVPYIFSKLYKCEINKELF